MTESRYKAAKRFLHIVFIVILEIALVAAALHLFSLLNAQG
jgi:hypothetical protein